MADDELWSWMRTFENQLEPSFLSHVYETLKANGFTTRLKLKLIREEDLGIMFNEVIPLGAKALLSYQLSLLNEESPLPSKAKARRTHQAETSSEVTETSQPTKKNVVRALQVQNTRLKEQLTKEKEDLQEIHMNIESMSVDIREPSPIGSKKTICGHCHHRGHKNLPTKPCVLKACTDYTYCGIKEKHPEYFSKLSTLKLEKRKKEKAILEMENQVKSMEQFSSSSEFQFVKNLTPRLYSIDASYKTNKAKLMRDVRLLREGLDGKIPPVTTNDAEQLHLLITKFKKNSGVTAKADADETDFESIIDSRPIDYSPDFLTSREISKEPQELPTARSSDRKLESKYSGSSSSEEEAYPLFMRDKKHEKKEKRRKKRARSSKQQYSSDEDFPRRGSPNFPFPFTMNPYVHMMPPYMNPFSMFSPGAYPCSETTWQPLFARPPCPPSTTFQVVQGNNSVTATATTTTPTKADFSNDSDPQSPNSEKAAHALLELGNNPH